MAADRHTLTSISQALRLRLVLLGAGFLPLPPGLRGIYTTFFPEKDLVRALPRRSLVMKEASASSMLMPWGSKMSTWICNVQR